MVGRTAADRARPLRLAARRPLPGFRGLLVNPNEKFYVSIAHTDGDVERTLAIVDDAFAALAAAR